MFDFKVWVLKINKGIYIFPQKAERCWTALKFNAKWTEFPFLFLLYYWALQVTGEKNYVHKFSFSQLNFHFLYSKFSLIQTIGGQFSPKASSLRILDVSIHNVEEHLNFLCYFSFILTTSHVTISKDTFRGAKQSVFIQLLLLEYLLFSSIFWNWRIRYNGETSY